MAISNRIGNHYKDQLPYFPDDVPDLDDALLIVTCPACDSDLECYEGEVYCPDCLSFTTK